MKTEESTATITPRTTAMVLVSSVGPGGRHVRDLYFETSAGPEPADPVVLEDRPRTHGDEADHRQDADADQQGNRAERTLGAVVRPWLAKALKHALSRSGSTGSR
jgi:hypothetical protein